jgi:predicted component of type VI protein secretion system
MYRFRMVMQKGPVPGTAFDISKPQMLVGRDPACDIVISDSEVSRRHARLVVREDACILEDLGSTNGTFVNGRRIGAPVELHPGDVIMMGENVLLAFESQAFDPNATVLSAAQQAPVSTAQMPAGSAFQAQVPQSPPVVPPPATGPLPPHVQPAPAAPKRKVLPWMLAGGGVLMLICACAVFLLWVDMTYRWCQFFPFLAGCG